MSNSKLLKNWLVDSRIEKKLDLERVSWNTGLSIATLTSLEKGIGSRRTGPNYKTLIALLKYYEGTICIKDKHGNDIIIEGEW